MSQIIKLPEIIKDFVNRVSGSNFPSYYKYAEHRNKIKRGEIETNLTYVENEQVSSGSLRGDKLKKIREEAYRNLKISKAEDLFISMGIKYPFSIFGANGNSSEYSSDRIFQNHLMLESITAKEWELFGDDELTAMFVDYEKSFISFSGIQINSENYHPFMNSPQLLTILSLWKKAPDIWNRYEKQDFEEGGKQRSAVGLKIEKEHPNISPTLAEDLAKWIKQGLFSKS